MKAFMTMLVVLALAGCKNDTLTKMRDGEIIALVKTLHKCQGPVRILDRGDDQVYPNWRVLDVCGVRRHYEFGKGSGGTFSWRERKVDD